MLSGIKKLLHNLLRARFFCCGTLAANTPRRLGTAFHRQRGSALTELVILIFPYAMTFIGVTVLGNLVLGRIEAQKASILAANLPEEQDLDYIQEHSFLLHDAGSPAAHAEIGFEENVGYNPPQDYATEEPVLPYDSPSDIHAGFVNLAYSASASANISNGQAGVSQSGPVMNGTGRYLADYHIMPEREADMADTLGDWVDYSRAITRFSYTYGGTSLPTEDDDDRDPRGTFTIRQDDEEGIRYFSATRLLDPSTGQPYTPGRHAVRGGALAEPEMDFGALASLDSTPSGTGSGTSTMDLSSLPEPVLDSLPADDLSDLWSTDFAANVSDWPEDLPLVDQDEF